ncbi:hypothetical protein [Pseudofrankia asymbiotica]|uniref:Aminoglycoside phosphotransferase domain-containing protein n=1 Tax=Pseudofrankia asymbiotica TaxID=1834516 RepID=A0A1V2II35_9ACTN|nr:hypothetical protein [Pseudofrankia asymbiotica]ONH32838.1 hypothetical protein BL253_03720 [Pseudofrankia asymbiotica]
MSAVAAGALAGALRTRPAGWLARELTVDPIAAALEADALLERHHPDLAGPVRCLTTRYRSATFTVGAPPHAVLKRHADKVAYLGERLAYDLLATDRVLPRLRGSCDHALTLITAYLPQAADLTRQAVFDELIETVVRVHTAPARWDRPVVDAMAPWRIDAALKEDTPWVRDSAAWRRMLSRVGAAHGPAHIPLGNLDLAPDHARRQADGRIALVDVETLRPDVTGLPDLVTLAYLAAEAGHSGAGPWVRTRYRHHQERAGGRWAERELVLALVDFAEATGLQSLHGLDH